MIVILRKLFDMMERRGRRRLVMVTILVLIMGLVEAIGVASILPFLAILTEPDRIETTPVLAFLYDLGGFETVKGFTLAVGFAVFFLILFGAVVRIFTTYVMYDFIFMQGYEIGNRLLAGVLAQPYVWFLDRHGSDVTKQIVAEVDLLAETVIQSIVNILAYGVIALVLVLLVLVIDPVVALAASVLIGGGYGLFFLAIRGTASRQGQIRLKVQGQRFRIVQEATGGIKEIKVAGLEESVVERFRQPNRRYAFAKRMQYVLGQVPRYVLELMLFGSLMVLLLQLVWSQEGGFQALIPVLGVYALAAARLFPTLQRIYQSLTRLRFNRACLDRVHADYMALGAMAVRAVGPDRGPVIKVQERIELRGVHYSYPSAKGPALNGLDLDIRARTKVGIVGGTGAGKSTTVDLILGLLEPQEGDLAVDGTPISGAQVPLWRRSIGYVPQSIFLMDETIRRNIAFGLPEELIDDAAVERAARAAELHDFITGELPAGYGTEVGERGVRLSGGQRQRIGIARALYHDPEVLIFDEATSALDGVTEQAVMESIARFGGTKTIIMIAHRLATVRDCDEIFLLEGGRVAARGSFDALVASNESFRAMARKSAAMGS